MSEAASHRKRRRGSNSDDESVENDPRAGDGGCPSLAQPSTSGDMGNTAVESLSRGLSQLSVENEEGTEEDKLKEVCASLGCLDGKYFKVDLTKSRLTGTVSAVCQMCEPEKTIKGSLRVTSNFTTHLKKIHPNKYDEYKLYTTAKRKKSQEPIVNRKRWSCTFSQDTFDENVTNYVLDSMAPLNTVEKPSFRRIFDDLNIKKGATGLVHMSRYSLAKRVDLVCKMNLAEIRDTISGVIANGGFICTTADMYTGGGRRFLGVTASWIHPVSMERKSAAIACKRFPGTHSYDAIANNLAQIHTSFGLTPENVRATVTDNGSNFVKAFKEFGLNVADKVFTEEVPETLQGDEELNLYNMEDNSTEVQAEMDFEFGNHCEQILPQHLRCASHTLNLIATTDIRKAIEDSEELSAKHSAVIEKCTSLWKTLRSPKMNEALKEYLGIALTKPIVTRWNSFYDAIKQILLVKEKLLESRFNQEIPLRDPFIRSDFTYLQEYVLCTEQLSKAIDYLQGDHCHYGLLLPTLVSLKMKLKRLSSNAEINFCRPLVKSIIGSVDKRFNNFFKLRNEGPDAAVAALSHPQVKGRWLGCLNEEAQKRVYDLFVQRVTDETNINRSANSNLEYADDFYFGDNVATIPELAASVSESEVQIEVSRYLRCTNCNINVLNDYPLVQKVFLKYNTPLPSSAPVERLFSYATMMSLPKYNRLTDNHFEERVIAKANSLKRYL